MWPCYDQVEHKVLELGLCKLFEDISINSLTRNVNLSEFNEAI